MKSIRLIVMLGVLALLAACGGGGGSNGGAHNTISGTAAAGFISGATVKVYDAASYGTATKKQIGASSPVNNGIFSVDVGGFTGAAVVEVTGGTYTDEATGAAGTPLAIPLRAAIGSVHGNVQVAVTPLTELAVRKALAADPTLAAATIASANAQISDLFKVDIIGVMPLDASASITGSNDTAAQDYTILLAGLSQYAKETSQTLDGSLTTLAGQITNGQMSASAAAALMTALNDFLSSGPTINKTGITTLSTNLQAVGTTSLKVTLALQGTGVGLVDATILVPANVTISTGANGVVLQSAFILPAGSTIAQESGVFTPAANGAQAQLHLLLPSATAAFVPGDLVTLVFNVAPGAAVPAASAFTVTNATVLYASAGGAPVAGTVTLH